MLTFHPGNPQAAPCDNLPSNTDKPHQQGGLGMDFHLKGNNNEDGTLEQ